MRHHLMPFVLMWCVILVAFLLSGCASHLFDNRVMCTLDGSQAIVNSNWGGFGISSVLTDADAAALCAEKLKVQSTVKF